MKISRSIIYLTLALCLVSCGKIQQSRVKAFSVIPRPAKVVLQDSSLDLSGIAFCVAAKFDPLCADAARRLAGRLTRVSGRRSKVFVGRTRKGSVQVAFDPALGEEEYSMDVSPDGILILASTPQGGALRLTDSCPAASRCFL